MQFKLVNLSIFRILTDIYIYTDSKRGGHRNYKTLVDVLIWEICPSRMAKIETLFQILQLFFYLNDFV